MLLFDIDGTLIHSTSGIGAGRRAFERAADDLFRAREHCRFSFNGLTDRSIARAVVTAVQEFPPGSEGPVPAAESAVEELLARYLLLLEEELDGFADYELLPGVVELLDALDELADRTTVAVGLGTGNLERGAELKLARVGLSGRFAFGGYGSDHEERAELIRAGARRGADRLGCDAGDCRVVVVGDTPRDVAAALAVGGECVAVATGGHRTEALLAVGAVAAFEDLTAPGVLEALLPSRPGR